MSSRKHQKDALRTRQLAALGAMDPTQRAEGSVALCRRLDLLEALPDARSILAFAPLGTEPDIGPLVESLRQEGRSVLLPRMGSDPDLMEAAPLTTPLEMLERDRMGVRSPGSGDPVPLEAIDLVLVPGVVFDRWGQRLGRGGGHYDRLLGRVSQAHLVGICFELAICDEIPVEPHDRRVDRIVTECRTIDCTGSSPPQE